MNTIDFNDIPSSASICFSLRVINADEMKHQIQQLEDALSSLNIQSLGLYLDNSPEWLYISFATLTAGISLIPLPVFFKPEQINHIISSTQMDGIVSHDPQTLVKMMPKGVITKLPGELYLIRASLKNDRDNAFQGIITFTSGSTGAPKGVLLPYNNIYKQLHAIYQHLQPKQSIKFLSLMPLSILLENLIAIDTLLHGGVVYLHSLSTFLDLNHFAIKVASLLDYLQSSEANTILLMPLFLEQIIDHLENNALSFPKSIDFIALGSAMASSSLLVRSAALKLPVYQGYGLSESSSIVSMNTLSENKIGSVGKVLPHIEVKISEQGAILIKGNLFYGYLGEPPIAHDEFFDTGDLGYLEDNFLYFTGRKKNLMVLSNGRNVSPEWIENELSDIKGIKHMVVEGDSRPFITVIIDPKTSFEEEIWQEQLHAVNQRLPSFAQVKGYIIAIDSFTKENQLLTFKNTPNKIAVRNLYYKELEAIYDSTKKEIFSLDQKDQMNRKILNAL